MRLYLCLLNMLYTLPVMVFSSDVGDFIYCIS